MSKSERRFSPSAWAVSGFTLFYTVIAVVWAFAAGNDEFKFYLLVLPLFFLVIGYLHFRIRFSTGLLWCLSVLTLMHMLGGLVLVSRSAPTEGKRLLYNLWLIEDVFKYDHLVHMFGGGIASWFCWQVLRRMWGNKSWLFRRQHPRPVVLMICALAGFGIGSINEVMEFAATRMVDDANVGGYANNALDLIANTAGGLIAAFLLWKLERPDAK